MTAGVRLAGWVGPATTTPAADALAVPPLIGSPPVGTCMASLNVPPLGWVATAMVGHARPPDPGGSTEVEM
jgi:hypothetical protein